MSDPIRPFMDPEAARQAAQQAADAARPGEALSAADALPMADDAAENLAADNLPAASDVALPEGPALADNMAQPEVLGLDVPNALDDFSSAASSEGGDDMLGDLDLGPWLSDSEDLATDAAAEPATSAETDAESSSFPADIGSGDMTPFSDGNASVDPFAASPPPFTGPLVEVSPGVFMYPGFSMLGGTDTAARASEPGQSHAGLPWLNLTLGSSQAERFMDKALDRSAMRLNRIVDEKIESALNYDAHVRNSQMRALNGR